MNIKKKEYSKKTCICKKKKTSTLKKAKGLSGSSASILELFLSKPNIYLSFKGTAIFCGIAYYKGLSLIKPDHSNTLLLPQGYETIIVLNSIANTSGIKHGGRQKGAPKNINS